MTICLDCKFAEWRRTSNGRLHPEGTGKCIWKASVPMAASFPAHQRDSIDRLTQQNFRYIVRGPISRINKCEVYAARKPEDAA